MSTESVLQTPIVDLGNYAGNHLWIKRDDLIPFSFGGNKARKAFGFFREFDAGNYDCIVTYGSSSSNHCRVVSNMAAQRNVPCYIIAPQEASEPTFNSKLMNVFGAKFTVCPVADVHKTITDKIEHLRRNGRKPFFIAGGGHGNVGTQAYVDCYNEICDFEKKKSIYFDYIFFASGTGTTQAGLVCGKMMHGDERHIIGISIARKNPRGRDVVIESIEDFLSEKSVHFTNEQIDENVVFIDDYTGNGYGCNNDEIQATIKSMMLNYGIPMDSTYVAKAFTGMSDFIVKQKVENKRILFIHTGGTPLFFDNLNIWERK